MKGSPGSSSGGPAVRRFGGPVALWPCGPVVAVLWGPLRPQYQEDILCPIPERVSCLTSFKKACFLKLSAKKRVFVKSFLPAAVHVQLHHQGHQGGHNSQSFSLVSTEIVAHGQLIVCVVSLLVSCTHERRGHSINNQVNVPSR